MSLSALNTSVPVGAIMMINAILFTAQTAMGVVLLKKVNTLKFVSHTGANSQVVTQIRVEFHDKVSVMLSLHGLINRILRVAPF